MKILLASNFFPPGHLGGTEILTYGLASGLRAAGHHVRVVCAEDWDDAPHQGVRTSDEEVQGIPVHRLKLNWRRSPHIFRDLYANPATKAHVRELLIDFQPDVFHVTSCYTLTASILRAAAQLGVPIVYTATDFWFLCARNSLLRSNGELCSGPEGAWKCAQCMLSGAKVYRWSKKLVPERLLAPMLLELGKSERWTNRRGLRGMHGDWKARFSYLNEALQLPQKIVTASHFLMSKLVEYGVEPGQITVSRYGLDLSWARGLKIEEPVRPLRIGFIGQILPKKGPDILVRAFRALEAEVPLELKIYGNLEKLPDFGQQLLELAGDDRRIHFLGTFPNEKMGEVLQGIDVLVVPSIWYDFPLVIPSAFAMKTPVIATDLPGMNELITHGKDGLLFPRGDWKALARLLRRLASAPSLVAELQASIGPVKDLPAMAAEYERLYRSLILEAVSSRHQAVGAS